MAARAIPAIGDLHEFGYIHGRLLVQERPMPCRTLCVCGECNGTFVSEVLPVREVIYWADNSIEARATATDGTTRRSTIAPPSGDRCF